MGELDTNCMTATPPIPRQHVLRPPPSALRDGEEPAPVTAVAVSRCGNFGIVGSASGAVHRYNLQSGLHRGAPPNAHSSGQSPLSLLACRLFLDL